jgi:peptidoglycan/xylan/chitin deacetylase (PgdA/CDA1 family)
MKLRRALRAIRIRIIPPKPKPLILMYHRIANEPLDPWGIAVSPAHFEEHLEVLRRTRHPLSLTNFVSRFLAGTLPSNAVAVTFDDGYVDNLIAGKPRLAAADVPATVFLATGYLGRAGEFWWDELARLILVGTGPQNLEFAVGGKIMRFDLGEEIARNATGWRAWLDEPRTARQEAYIAIWKAFRTLETKERDALMAQLRKAFVSSPPKGGWGRPMTLEEVQELVEDHLVAIGPHTVSHPALTELDPSSRRREIAASKKTCEALAGVEVCAFAYPFGNLDAEVRAAIGAAGFTCACSTRHGPVTFDSDVFALPRIQVPDSNGDSFERSLRYASIAK